MIIKRNFADWEKSCKFIKHFNKSLILRSLKKYYETQRNNNKNIKSLKK